MRAFLAAWLAVVMGWERRRLRPRDPSAGAHADAHLAMTTEVSSIRVYDRPGGYDERRPYLGIVTVTHLTDRIVYLHGAVGKIDRATRAQALEMLRSRGVTTVMLERHGRMKTIELSAPAAALQQVTQ